MVVFVLRNGHVMVTWVCIPGPRFVECVQIYLQEEAKALVAFDERLGLQIWPAVRDSHFTFVFHSM